VSGYVTSNHPSGADTTLALNLVANDDDVMDVGTKRVQSPSASDTHVMSGEPLNATVTPGTTPMEAPAKRSPFTFTFNATCEDVG